jgi:hypothetical protein
MKTAFVAIALLGMLALAAAQVSSSRTLLTD